MWHFVLEAANNDPLRAMEIWEKCLSDDASFFGYLWFERWFADRDERIKCRNEQRPGQPARSFLPIPEKRTPFRLEPDGRLIPVEAA